MKIKIDINNVKSTIFLELLNLFKKTTYDDEVLDDLSMIGDSLRDAKNGLGHKTSTVVNIKDA